MGECNNKIFVQLSMLFKIAASGWEVLEDNQTANGKGKPYCAGIPHLTIHGGIYRFISGILYHTVHLQ
jgi:hypothetical protein